MQKRKRSIINNEQIAKLKDGLLPLIKITQHKTK